MKYMCMECRRIHESGLAALDCCERTKSIPDEQVAPCQDGGETCDNPDCVFCQGTGLMLKPAEKVQRDSREASQNGQEPGSLTLSEAHGQ